MYVFLVVALVYLTWVHYLAIMRAQEVRDSGKLKKVTEKVAIVMLGIGYLLDFTLNVTLGTLLFLEFPKEALLSPRVARHKLEGKGYRKKLAGWICDNLLDPFDPSGCHCKEGLYK